MRGIFRNFKYLSFIAPIFTLSCISRSFEESTIRLDADQCSTGVTLNQFIQRKQETCYASGQSGEYDNLKAFNPKYELYPWIPCNEVRLVSMAKSRFEREPGKGFSSGNPHFYDFETAKEYLRDLKVDMKALSDQIFSDPSLELPTSKLTESAAGKFVFSKNPVFDSPIHQAMVGVIRSAQERLYVNFMLFGGSWGAEVMREVLLKIVKAKNENRNFQVIVMHDFDNVFVFESEMKPLWDKMFSESISGPFSEHLVVMSSDISQRVTSAMPIGLSALTAPLQGLFKTPLSLLGTSDHSKIIISDPFTNNAQMIVQSKNISDFNHTNFDEGAVIKGPAASVSMITFKRDIELAAEKSSKKIKSFAAKKDQIKQWLSVIEFAASPKSTLKVSGPGKSDVMLVENNADDSVRNLEHAVLKLMSSAKKNLRAYNMLAYHNMVAKAYADSSKRLSKTPQGARMILDATLVYPLNQLFESMLKQELLFEPKKPNFRAGTEAMAKVDLTQNIRWRKFLPPIFQKSKGLIDVEPQQHTKTIVVDDLYTLLGSSNFDLNSLKGAFREFSVIIKDPGVARQSAEIFDSIWSNSSETVDSNEIVELKKMPEMGGVKPLPESIRGELIKAAQFESDRNETINPRNFKRRGDQQGPLDDNCF